MLINKLKFFLSTFLVLISTQSYALICSDYGDFKEYGGHYYSTTVSKLTYKDAKLLAENSGGYLAIPDTQAENDFITSLVKGGQYAWIGVYDPNYTSNYCYGTGCVYDDSRFKTIKNGALTYKKWAFAQPDNLLRSYDIVDGVEKVSPLGEHWVALASPSGEWADFGNHFDEYNNPVQHYAVYEFDTMPECYTPPTNFQEDQIAGTQCSTKIYNKDIDQTIDTGQLYDCQQDQYGTDYCPAQMAPCATEWNYGDGYSVLHTASITEYANTTTINHTIEADTKNVFVRNLTATECCQYRFGNEVIAGRYVWDDWGEAVFCTHTTQNIRDRYNERNWNRRCAGTPTDPTECYHHGPEYTRACFNNKQCPVGYRNASGGDTSCIKTISQCPEGYTPVYGSINGVYRGVHVQDTWITSCSKNEYLCPDTSWTKVNNSTCKKVKTYTYYDYLCDPKTNIYGQSYTPQNLGGDCLGKNLLPDGSCNSSTPPKNNCHRKTFTCKEAPDRKCAYVNNQYQCSPYPCFGGDDIETTDTQVGLNDADNNGWDNSGNCLGQIYIFNGQDNRCRSKDILFGLVGGGCCDKDKVFLGLVACKEEEKKLAKLNDQERCHYVGEYCSKKLNLGFTKICVQWKKSHCCFNSKLARIINEQGRPQLAKGWGSAESPECKGFTPEEFQKLDFSKIDMSEFFGEIQQNFNVNFMQNQQNFIQNRITNNMNNISGN